MGNTKHRKNHKQKLKARQERIKNEKNRANKLQREFIMDLIKKEQERGAYNNVQPLNIDPLQANPNIEGPSI